MMTRDRRGPRRIKRCLDVLLAGLGLAFLSPLMVAIALAVRVAMGGPVVFRQRRVGENKRTFILFKFRTMTDGCGPDGETLPDAERLKPFGILLRKSSLDELPQLWNVFRGELSLVGPRPMPLRYLPHFTQEECERFLVPPGITGWAQVHGRNNLPWTARFAFDVWYVRNWSLQLDARILLRTLAQILSGRDVVPDASAVMKDFDEERMERDASVQQ